jgi:hypothetical protein
MKLEYTIVRTADAAYFELDAVAEQLATKVHEHIYEGWEPIGGVAVAHGPRGDGSLYFYLRRSTDQ